MDKISKKIRVSLDLMHQDFAALEECCTNRREVNKADFIRRVIKTMIEVNAGKLFISTDKNCSGKVPISIL